MNHPQRRYQKLVIFRELFLSPIFLSKLYQILESYIPFGSSWFASTKLYIRHCQMMAICKQKRRQNHCDCNFSNDFFYVFAPNVRFRRSIPEKWRQFLKAPEKLHLLIYNNWNKITDKSNNSSKEDRSSYIFSILDLLILYVCKSIYSTSIQYKGIKIKVQCQNRM